MRTILAFIALISGVILAFQVGFNNGLRLRMGHVVLAALTSFGVGTTCLIVYGIMLRPPLPTRGQLAGAPLWVWMGGVVGAVYVAASAAFATRLGAATWLALVVTGQVLASLVLDHFGLVGFPTRPVGLAKLVGVALLLAGVVLVLRS